jgi:hypothetical protein
MRVKMRVDSYNGHHVVATLFAGEGDTLANIGTLRMHTGEYQLIGVALSLGAKQMHGLPLTVEHEDAVFKEAADRLALQETEEKE